MTSALAITPLVTKKKQQGKKDGQQVENGGDDKTREIAKIPIAEGHPKLAVLKVVVDRLMELELN